jgi:hypothetical protein
MEYVHMATKSDSINHASAQSQNVVDHRRSANIHAFAGLACPVGAIFIPNAIGQLTCLILFIL